MREYRGGGGAGVRTHLKNRNAIGFLSNTGPDPLKITKLPSQHSMLGHHRPASETSFEWRFAGAPLMARFLVVFGSSLLSSTKKGLSELDPLCHNFLDPRMKCPNELVRSLSYHSDIVMLIFMANRRNCIIYINSIITGRSPLLALAYFHDINTEKKNNTLSHLLA